MTDANETSYDVLPKLTIANMKCEPFKAKSENRDIHIATIYGVANACKPKTAPSGDVHYPITGSFEGVNATTGEVFRSGILYLPAGIHEMLSEPLINATAENIEFGVELYATPAKNPIGYSYKAKPVIKPTAADPLTKLRAQVQPTKQLSGPSKEEAKKKSA